MQTRLKQFKRVLGFLICSIGWIVPVHSDSSHNRDREICYGLSRYVYSGSPDDPLAKRKVLRDYAICFSCLKDNRVSGTAGAEDFSIRIGNTEGVSEFKGRNYIRFGSNTPKGKIGVGMYTYFTESPEEMMLTSSSPSSEGRATFASYNGRIEDGRDLLKGYWESPLNDGIEREIIRVGVLTKPEDSNYGVNAFERERFGGVVILSERLPSGKSKSHYLLFDKKYLPNKMNYSTPYLDHACIEAKPPGERKPLPRLNRTTAKEKEESQSGDETVIRLGNGITIRGKRKPKAN